MTQFYQAIDTKTATVSTSSATSASGFSFSAADLDVARKAVITAGANPIKLTWSGVTATSTVGHYVGANENVIIEGDANVNNLSMIAIGGNSTVTVTLEEAIT